MIDSIEVFLLLCTIIGCISVVTLMVVRAMLERTDPVFYEAVVGFSLVRVISAVAGVTFAFYCWYWLAKVIGGLTVALPLG